MTSYSLLGFMGGLTNLWINPWNFFIFILIAWSLFWKGLALWEAARRNSKAWFVTLLVINTVGILEILYLYVFSRKKNLS